MSEKLHLNNNEKLSRDEKFESHGAHQERHEGRKEDREKQSKLLEKARESVHEIKTENVTELENAIKGSTENIEHSYVEPSEIKKVSLVNNLSVIRRNLSEPQRAMSKIIHRPLINYLSEVSAKYLIKPLAMLLGGIFTLIGSLYYLYATQRTG